MGLLSRAPPRRRKDQSAYCQLLRPCITSAQEDEEEEEEDKEDEEDEDEDEEGSVRLLQVTHTMHFFCSTSSSQKLRST